MKNGGSAENVLPFCISSSLDEFVCNLEHTNDGSASVRMEKQETSKNLLKYTGQWQCSINIIIKVMSSQVTFDRSSSASSFWMLSLGDCFPLLKQAL